MYFTVMMQTRHELMGHFTDPVFLPHPVHTGGVRTFSCVRNWNQLPGYELPSMRLSIEGIDYLEYTPTSDRTSPPNLKFHRDDFCLWYQVDGNGILQNTSRNIFGAARPGLIGVMERGMRYGYLHQKGRFECFQLFFSLFPARNAKCYWNSGIEGKAVLEESERRYFENLVFDLLLLREKNGDTAGLRTAARLLDIVGILFSKKLLSIEDAQFPKNKPKSLVAKARSYMERNYRVMHHQADLARECGVDINYLNVLFKKETGMTLHDFLLSVRIERAKHLLETTDTSIADIARDTGYPNANSFSRAFRRREKRSPGSFKRLARSGAASLQQ